MPEGDSLVRLADRLRPVLAGRQLERTDFRVPRLATLDLSGARIHSVRPRAKYLLMDAGELTVLSHLKMEGRWEAYPRLDAAGGRLTPRWRHPGWQARCVLETERDQVVGFQLGLLEVLPTAGVAERLGFLGPDLLDPDWADPGGADPGGDLLAEAVLRIAAAADRPIGLALLDQRLVSGIGNIYRCEALLLAGLDPHRPVASVPDLPGLITLTRDLMRVNTRPAGPGRPAPRRTTTGVAPDPTAPYGVRVPGAGTAGREATAAGAAPPSGPRPGRGREPHYWVYGRRREGCLRCGGPVTVEDFGDLPGQDRTLYWCRHCQR
ncbi:DNA-formamidopyrimidine glycosylase family protein [Citricoccus sp. NPDC055426]|uniref:DNA-formamidopyrimidine glycosylase family protein n=1 Tax=Citricoccus sp. NPDC055426 TaxID=3155536 RepID=UPI00342B4909